MDFSIKILNLVANSIKFNQTTSTCRQTR
jgi:hypothetical protein